MDKDLRGYINEFPIDIRLHQASALSPFLFTMAMDELIQEEVPWGVLSTDNIVLIDETMEGFNKKLERWRYTLKVKDFRLSMLKIKYLK